jgi:hypothetical protein
VRGVIFAVGFAVAFGATAGLAYLALRSSPDDPLPETSSGTAVRDVVRPAPVEEPQLRIRPYETTATLVEDLRDALAGDPKKIDGECWRVSRALGSSARWTLTHLATERKESSPRVRALLVLAAGVHVQGEDLLLLRLEDSDARVRRAAVLAASYGEDGVAEELLGVRVPLGRKPEGRMALAVTELAEADPDEAVRRTAKRILAMP